MPGFESCFDNRMAFPGPNRCDPLAPPAIPERVCQSLKLSTPTENALVNILEPDFDPCLWMARGVCEATQINGRVRGFPQKDKRSGSLRSVGLHEKTDQK